MPSVKPQPLQFALREMHDLARQPRVWLALACIAALIGMIGPFETFKHPLGPRLAYWAVIVVSTGALGTFGTLVMVALLPDSIPVNIAVGLGGLVAGAPVGLLVWLINLFAFGPDNDNMPLGLLVAYCIPVAGLVATMGHMLTGAITPSAVVPESPATEPALLERLPVHQRGKLLHLAVADHYVDVTTDRGTTLVLIRLSDAIRETAPTLGLQVHRSHWVALDAVRRSARQSGKPVLELVNGTIVPVSRTYLAAVRAAGLLA